MRRLGTALMVTGALATAAALVEYAGWRLPVLGYAIVGGMASPRSALAGGAVLLAGGAVVRRRADAPGPVMTTVRVLAWAAAVGLVGFLLGFFGPLVLTPDSAQGPLLGYVITGPAGVVFGALYGARCEVRRRRPVPTRGRSGSRPRLDA